MTDEELDASLLALAADIRMPEEAVAALPRAPKAVPWRGLAVAMMAAVSLWLIAVPGQRTFTAGTATSVADTSWFDASVVFPHPWAAKVARDRAIEQLAATHPELSGCVSWFQPYERDGFFHPDLRTGEAGHRRVDEACLRAFGERDLVQRLREPGSVLGADLRLWPWESQRSIFETWPRHPLRIWPWESQPSPSAETAPHRLWVTLPPDSDAVIGSLREMHRVRGGGTFELKTTDGVLYLTPYGGEDPRQVLRIGPIEGECTWSFPESGKTAAAPSCR